MAKDSFLAKTEPNSPVLGSWASIHLFSDCSHLFFIIQSTVNKISYISLLGTDGQ